MEACAAISATRLRGGHMLTASIDRMTFAKPTKVGDILYISSQVAVCDVQYQTNMCWKLMALPNRFMIILEL